MTDRRITPISQRKQPRQARSTELVAVILEAAVQVLAQEGVRRFTTARVAEKAGVGVGSLYQYFPNKAAILFRLQSDEWRQTANLLRDILEDTRKPPLGRLRSLVHAFLRSECEEAAMRVALNDAAPLYRDAPEAQEARSRGDGIFKNFMTEALPKAPDATRTLAGELLWTTLRTVGKQFSQTPRLPAEIDAYAEAMADMFGAYLGSLGRG
ncbi:TetR family transcriptional regulator [Solidesulfovibrio sp.]|uniref:TetR family transcriptional regulator n=1 Tax=Solidesulfovibrio sp. TaxID=2910990 RepID=UPI00260A5010|nr:TetR family transcriptional regulator [Solidesulfovibrio sp.]